MLRGTRLIEGEEARIFGEVLSLMRERMLNYGYEEVFLPTLAEPVIWTGRSGQEIEGQMWTFPDKKERPCCLIPEATALIQKQYDESWAKTKKKPVRLIYTTRCYRYERPQAGRYREFSQFGLEILGPNPTDWEEHAKHMLKECLGCVGVDYDFNDDVKRGLSYYTRNGFEALVPSLGAQQQIAGGGVYEQGVGWAIGVDRLVLALMRQRYPEEFV